MGNSSNDRSQLLQYLKISSITKYLQNRDSLEQDQFSIVSVINSKDHDRLRFSKIFQSMKEDNYYDKKFLKLQNQEIQKSIASLLGLAICDALGASTQFKHYLPKGYGIIKNSFKDIQIAINQGDLTPRAGKVGIWTDDCSMALCMADSLIYNNYQFVPKHMRYMFILWIMNGLNNGGRKQSIGLGGNIRISLEQFMEYPSDYCQKSDQMNNGNGSLMRLAPIPIVFRQSDENSMNYSQKSSLTTHNGIQAKQCCRLLSFILTNLYKNKDLDRKKVLSDACQRFQTQCQSVQFLALSAQEPFQNYNECCKKFGDKFMRWNRSIRDRNWNWKDINFTYSETRTYYQPGYIGSYCMDALSMALHTVWHTSTFKEVAILNANLGGDCDTVGAIAGQIAGAMYGISNEMLKFYSQMVDFQSGRYQIFLKAYKLAKKSKIDFND